MRATALAAPRPSRPLGETVPFTFVPGRMHSGELTPCGTGVNGEARRPPARPPASVPRPRCEEPASWSPSPRENAAARRAGCVLCPRSRRSRTCRGTDGCRFWSPRRSRGGRDWWALRAWPVGGSAGLGQSAWGQLTSTRMTRQASGESNLGPLDHGRQRSWGSSQHRLQKLPLCGSRTSS